jgi:site-specific DNA recombinase
MIVGIYARNSNDQNISGDLKSTQRHIQLSREFAAARGWRVGDEYIFADDAISGSEFARRPALVRLLATVERTSPPFRALVLADKDRVGREQLESGFILKRLLQSGIRVYEYQSQRELQLSSPLDKITMAIENFSAEMEREKAAVRSRDALVARARRGAVTGGRLFSYSQSIVLGPDGRRSYVQRVIEAEQAAAVKDIFERFARGQGFQARRR